MGHPTRVLAAMRQRRVQRQVRVRLGRCELARVPVLLGAVGLVAIDAGGTLAELLGRGPAPVSPSQMQATAGVG